MTIDEAVTMAGKHLDQVLRERWDDLAYALLAAGVAPASDVGDLYSHLQKQTAARAARHMDTLLAR
jgi:hypothetical protein